eukprot:maker-scaffold1269_size51662-snap-gene-0.10 protein:Tk10472 transcript:maker-scaffold1269_size51662-snap-gene-0.10-mRNA-1 annotation:"maltase- intestinal-like"
MVSLSNFLLSTLGFKEDRSFPLEPFPELERHWEFALRSLFLGCILLEGSSGQSNSARIDCEPEGNADQSLCYERGCIYEEVLNEPGVPWCYFPDNYGYSMVGEPQTTANGITVELQRNANLQSLYGSDFETLTVVAEFQTNQRLRVTIEPKDEARFRVPIPINSGSGAPEPIYDVKFVQEVIRKSTGTVIFDTGLPGFVFSDQFIQVSTKLPSTNVYGLGENEQYSYRHDLNWKRWVAYGRDQPPSYDANMYGTHPMYTVVEDDGNTHSVLFLNSNAQEWTLTPNPNLVFRTIGGIVDMHFFLGPTPQEANRQYTEAIGRYPLPPYWSLGFHLCRYGYNTLENMKAAVDRTAAYGIPQDAQWGDIDIMERNLDFTLSQDRFGGLPAYVDELHERGMKFVTILDPCISTGETNYRPYDLGNDMDVWAKKPSGKPTLGRVWPDDATYFADYSKQATKDWWKILINDFHDTLAFDALWIDMNEPANFITGDETDNGCQANNINYPPYKPHTVGDELADKTLCPDTVHEAGIHYDTHNMYGYFQSGPTWEGVRESSGERGWILSRSTFVGSGNWAAHWLGDNFSNWDNLFRSIVGMLQFNRFGIPHVGADICGFIDDTNEELCARWMELGAFYPFARNHNGLGYMDQDPGSFGDTVGQLSADALRFRYRFLPHLYSLFYQHYTMGDSVARALWDEFPTDSMTWPVDRQFLWGSSFMVSPVVEQGATTKDVYFPDARWFDISDYVKTGLVTEVTTRGVYQTIDCPLNKILIHVRGGRVFPLQTEDMNTLLSRSNPWQLLIALDDEETAVGELFMDDGIAQDTIQNGNYFHATFQVSEGKLTNAIEQSEFSLDNELYSAIDVLGVKSEVSSVQINSQDVDSFTLASGRLTIDTTGLDIAVGASLEVIWS